MDLTNIAAGYQWGFSQLDDLMSDEEDSQVHLLPGGNKFECEYWGSSSARSQNKKPEDDDDAEDIDASFKTCTSAIVTNNNLPEVDATPIPPPQSPVVVHDATPIPDVDMSASLHKKRPSLLSGAKKLSFRKLFDGFAALPWKGDDSSSTLGSLIFGGSGGGGAGTDTDVDDEPTTNTKKVLVESGTAKKNSKPKKAAPDHSGLPSLVNFEVAVKKKKEPLIVDAAKKPLGDDSGSPITIPVKLQRTESKGADKAPFVDTVALAVTEATKKKATKRTSRRSMMGRRNAIYDGKSSRDLAGKEAQARVAKAQEEKAAEQEDETSLSPNSSSHSKNGSEDDLKDPSSRNIRLGDDLSKNNSSHHRRRQPVKKAAGDDESLSRNSSHHRRRSKSIKKKTGEEDSLSKKNSSHHRRKSSRRQSTKSSYEGDDEVSLSKNSSHHRRMSVSNKKVTKAGDDELRKSAHKKQPKEYLPAKSTSSSSGNNNKPREYFSKTTTIIKSSKKDTKTTSRGGGGGSSDLNPSCEIVIDSMPFPYILHHQNGGADGGPCASARAAASTFLDHKALAA